MIPLLSVMQNKLLMILLNREGKLIYLNYFMGFSLRDDEIEIVK